MQQDSGTLTDTLCELSEGAPKSQADRWIPIVYAELKALAGSYLKNERANHSLQPTALVNEAYMRLAQIDRLDWKGRTHFFAMAARQMRRVLVDHARRRNAVKRPDIADRVTLEGGSAISPQDSIIDLLALDEALTHLESLNARQAEIAQSRLFAGLSVKETAEALGVSERTVKADWRVARAWLMETLGPSRS